MIAGITLAPTAIAHKRCILLDVTDNRLCFKAEFFSARLYIARVCIGLVSRQSKSNSLDKSNLPFLFYIITLRVTTGATYYIIITLLLLHY